MVNKKRGEIEAHLNGKTYKLCLTLGALAELEDAFELESLMALTRHFEKGTFSSRDLARLIGAGLRGGGHKISNEDVLLMQIDEGITGFVTLAQKLLLATFGNQEA